ncbi:hypothetical protein [Arsenophonus endosymbiont of Aleurodicus floccissimus]|uniref:hypothetical protein n=1 Tax=Arsenophonus endosymbiont of Aleurodicus floccissimus TaxID=2152761 RepID=UPI000E6B2298|nr:hypothetical protein [Arsenophonus endosymbiont of Aleurodicus floccissimus]
MQQINTNETKQTVITDFDKLSQVMNQWGLLSNKSEIEEQLQILSEPNKKDSISTIKMAYKKILAFILRAEFACEKHLYDFNIEVVVEYNNPSKIVSKKYI